MQTQISLTCLILSPPHALVVIAKEIGSILFTHIFIPFTCYPRSVYFFFFLNVYFLLWDIADVSAFEVQVVVRLELGLSISPSLM